MDADDLKFFEVVARLGGINRAAAELNTVQSNVTSRIRALEDDLGTTLFHRHARGVSATAAAQRLLPYAVLVRNLLEDARRAVHDDGRPAGSLMIGSLETTAAVRLSPLLATFVDTYPDVDLSLRTGTSCELIEDVRQHRVEGAFVCGPVIHPDLVTEPVFQEVLVAVTASRFTSLDALINNGDFRLIVLRAGCSYRLRLEALLARRGVVGTRMLEFGTLDAILACVAAGLGITLLPRAMVENARLAGQVSIHAFPSDEALVETVFVRRRDAYLSGALKALLETMRPRWAESQVAA